MKSNTPDVFWARVEKGDGCWLWQGTVFDSGYGAFCMGGKTRRAHRVAFELTYGPIPKGLFVLHRCDNPRCVRPAHLYEGTHQDNIADMVMRDRAAKGDRNGSRLYPERRPRGDTHWMRLRPESRAGENNGRHKLSKTQVLIIRERYANGERQAILAHEYGVTQTNISDIIHERTWKD